MQAVATQSVTWLIRVLVLVGVACAVIALSKMLGYLPTRTGILRSGSPIEWCVLSANILFGAHACKALLR